MLVFLASEKIINVWSQNVFECIWTQQCDRWNIHKTRSADAMFKRTAEFAESIIRCSQ